MKPIFLFNLLLAFATMACAQNNTMETVKYPYDVHTATINDSLELAYLDEGAGEQTLVMIHGLGSYSPAWKQLIEELKGTYRCIALDLPGYGKSSTGAFPYSMDFFAETIAAFMEQLDIEPAILVGHSMGGQVAMTLALAKPDLLKNLILIAPAGFETFTEPDQQWFSTLVTPEAILATPPERIRLNFAVNFNQMQFPESAEFMYADRMALKKDSLAYQAYTQMIPQCVDAMLEAPVFDRLSSLKAKTLIIYGKGDLLIPNKILHPDLTTEAVAKEAVTKIPQAELLMLDDCGHFVQWECAHATAQAIQSFLK